MGLHPVECKLKSDDGAGIVLADIVTQCRESGDPVGKVQRNLNVPVCKIVLMSLPNT